MVNKSVMGVILLMLMIAGVSAVTELPNWKDKYVNDYGNILNESQKSELGVLFSGVDSETTAEITFISVQECAPYAPSDLAIKLLNYWGVGKKDKNNGFLILYCVREKKIYGASGYGLEGILPDSKIGRLLDENYVIKRDSGDISGGIVDFSYSIAQVIMDNKAEVLSGQTGGNNGLTIDEIIIFFFIFFIVMRIISAIMRKSGAKKSGFWFLPIFLPSRGGGGFGGGGFSGGFGGGGGGGGGAGR